MTNGNSKHKSTTKDKIIIALFIVLIILNLVRHIILNGFDSIGTMIEQTILLMLSFVGLVKISHYVGWNVFVPDFYEHTQKKKRKEEIQNYTREYFKEDINFIRDYDEERISFFISQLGISINQLDRIRLNLIRMRCLSLNNLEDCCLTSKMIKP